MERLQKKIANSGFCSRRSAEELIKDGRVRVNDEVITMMGYKVSDKDKIFVDDKLIVNEEKIYFLLNKPRGVISTTDDDKNRKSITELIDTDVRIFPVGRLDYDTTGVIILTNDGELSNILTSSKNNVEKTYIAKVKGMITPDKIYSLKNGIVLDGVKTKKAKVKVKRYNKESDTSLVEITITEGRNHQVKNMFKEVGNPVIKLKRERFAFLDLTGLNSGDYRRLNPKEVKRLYSLKK